MMCIHPLRRVYRGVTSMLMVLVGMVPEMRVNDLIICGVEGVLVMKVDYYIWGWLGEGVGCWFWRFITDRRV